MTDTVSAMDATIIWNDQGWGNLEGRVRFALYRGGTEIYAANVVFGIAPHSTTTVTEIDIQDR